MSRIALWYVDEKDTIKVVLLSHTDSKVRSLAYNFKNNTTETSLKYLPNIWPVSSFIDVTTKRNRITLEQTYIDYDS